MSMCPQTGIFSYFCHGMCSLWKFIDEFFGREMCGFNAQINVCCYSFRVVNLLNLFCSKRTFFSFPRSSLKALLVAPFTFLVTLSASISFQHFSPLKLSKKDRETFIFLQCAIAIMSLHYGHVSKRKKTKKLHICYRKFPFRVFQLIFTFLIKWIFLLFQCFPILIEFPF